MAYNPPKRRRNRPASYGRFGQRLTRVFLRLMLALALLVVLGGIGCVGWLFVRFLFVSEFFVVDEILVTGTDIRTEGQIRRALFQKKLDRGRLPSLSTEAIRQAVESVPRVRTAHVAKRYPGEIYIEVELREVVALLLADPILAIDREGFVVEKMSSSNRAAADFAYITGVEPGHVDSGGQVQSESLTKALHFLSCLKDKAPVLHRLVSEIHCGAEGTLTLLLRGGTEIRFGLGDPTQKMPALETFLKEMGRAEEFSLIDLRFEGQIPWKPKPEAN